jgi:hypothetical protein
MTLGRRPFGVYSAQAGNTLVSLQTFSTELRRVPVNQRQLS